MFVPAPLFWRLLKKQQSRQFASQRLGFVSTLLITLRLGLTHTRLIGLRAANSACRRLSCLSRLSLFFFVSPFGSPVPCQSLGSPGASGDVLFCFRFSPLFFLSAVKFFAGRFSLSLSAFVFLCVFGAPCKSPNCDSCLFWPCSVKSSR